MSGWGIGSATDRFHTTPPFGIGLAEGRWFFYMKAQSVRRQAALLACANALVRGLGFALRVALSRLLGAETLGIMELSHSAHMLSITPVTAGLPAAVSRLTALRRDAAALRAGRDAALRMSAVLLPLWVLLCPLMARLLGDARALPPLWAFAPCIPVLGLSAVYHGYCYGRGLAWPPALGTLMEQALRFVLSALPLALLPGLSVSLRAAVPALATALAEGAALLLILVLLRRAGLETRAAADPALRGEVLRLSAPLTGARLMQTLSRSLMAALLPRLLLRGGSTPGEAAAAVGMLQGMVLPVLFLPGIFTGAVGVVGTPAIAGRRGAARRQTVRGLLAASLACGILGGSAAYGLAGFLAVGVYGVPELAGLFRAAAPLTLLFALGQAAGTLLSGLGLQRRMLLPAALGTALTVALLCRWAPVLGIYGGVYALMLGQAVTLLMQFAAALPAISGERP